MSSLQSLSICVDYDGAESASGNYTTPVMYKTTNNRKSYWKISVIDYELCIERGIVDTKKPVITYRTVEAKSTRTLDEQCWQEVSQRIKEKIQDGYVSTVVTTASTPSLLPMLANNYDGIKNMTKFWESNKRAQPKLDGVRGIMLYEDGKVKIYSRTLHEYNNLDHIRKDFTDLVPHSDNELANKLVTDQQIVLDGELFSPSLKFEEITSISRQLHQPHENELSLSYWVFDCRVMNEPDKPYIERRKLLESMFSRYQGVHIRLVEDTEVTQESFKSVADNYAKMGYEGVMLRNPKAKYESKRSSNLIKYKYDAEDDAKIVDVVQKQSDIVFLLDTGSVKFDHRPEGSDATKKEWIDNPKSIIGMTYTYRYSGSTKNGIPKAIHDGRIRYDL